MIPSAVNQDITKLGSLLNRKPNLSYESRPIKFFRRYVPDVKWPKVFKQIFADIFLERVGRAIIKAPRGGGKSKLLSMLGFAKWYFQNRSIIDMGGSQEQAKGVYNYFASYCTIHDAIKNSLPKEPTMSYTETELGAYFKCITASPKQIRGPHPDILLADEVCETKDELIEAATPMIDTSAHAQLIMSSTFHKIFGVFQETWDKAPELGYTRYAWDIFDVCQQFSPAIWQEPKIKNIQDIDQLIKLSKGRTGDPEGWVPILNIIQAWREKPTLDHFLVEMMGNRPSASGLVLRPEDVEAALFDDSINTSYNYIDGAECSIGIDWGFSSMTSVTEWMKAKDRIKVMLDNINYQQILADKIIEEVVKKCKDHKVKTVFADVEGKFENAQLKNELKKANCNTKVIEVVFSTEKASMLGNLRSHFENHLIKIPNKFKEAYWQYKRYRYVEGTNMPKKKDDHIPDSTMCALQQWPLTKFKSRPPKAGLIKDTDMDKPTFGGIINEQF